MTLLEKQKKFAFLVSTFIQELSRRGYEVTFGEVFRPRQTAEIYAMEGKGIANSLHIQKLAVDLNLFKNLEWLNTVEALEEAGRIWEKFSTAEYMCCWGGRFSKPDADHFSIEHEGVK